MPAQFFLQRKSERDGLKRQNHGALDVAHISVNLVLWVNSEFFFNEDFKFTNQKTNKGLQSRKLNNSEYTQITCKVFENIILCLLYFLFSYFTILPNVYYLATGSHPKAACLLTFLVNLINK